MQLALSPEWYARHAQDEETPMDFAAGSTEPEKKEDPTSLTKETE